MQAALVAHVHMCTTSVLRQAAAECVCVCCMMYAEHATSISDVARLAFDNPAAHVTKLLWAVAVCRLIKHGQGLYLGFPGLPEPPAGPPQMPGWQSLHLDCMKLAVHVRHPAH